MHYCSILFVLLITVILCFSEKVDLVRPYDGMKIDKSMKLKPGDYQFDQGISIVGNNIMLDLTGVRFFGPNTKDRGDETTLVNCIVAVNVKGVEVLNGFCKGYFYGLVVINATNIAVTSCNFSNNHVDPAALGSSPPWLAINAPPNLKDKTNLGGGVFFQNVDHSIIQNCTLCHQENGIDLYSVKHSEFLFNNATHNTGWGIHLYKSCFNKISSNNFNNNTRSNLGDSSGILLVMSSNNNEITENQCQSSGDGFFIGNEAGCPSNDNFIYANDCSYSYANCFETTFSKGNQFIGNIASHCSHGFWLGYSHTAMIVLGNTIEYNTANGIDIDHGQNVSIMDNSISYNKGVGIYLHTDGKPHFPAKKYPCMHLKSETASTEYIISDNRFLKNQDFQLKLEQTTDSLVYNNIFETVAADKTAGADKACVRVLWNMSKEKYKNIVGGPYQAGNYWSNYKGKDTDGDGIGDTYIPYSNNGNIQGSAGDKGPLVAVKLRAE